MSKEKAMEHLKAAMSILEAVEKEQKPELGYAGDTEMEGDYEKKASASGNKEAKKKMLAMALKKKGMA
jgi:hypothetical protein